MKNEKTKLINAHVNINLDLFALFPIENEQNRKTFENEIRNMIIQLIKSKGNMSSNYDKVFEENAISVNINEIFDLDTADDVVKQHEKRLLTEDEFYNVLKNSDEKGYQAFYD